MDFHNIVWLVTCLGKDGSVLKRYCFYSIFCVPFPAEYMSTGKLFLMKINSYKLLLLLKSDYF